MHAPSRRRFLQSSAAASAAAVLSAVPATALAEAEPPADAEQQVRRVGVIGRTGRGNYGHGLDTVWLQIPGVQIVGVADANRQGLSEALQRLRVDSSHGYTDYQTMLRSRRPHYVAVCSRHVDQHAAMMLTAIEAGARGLFVEKPFCRTPAEADAVMAAAAERGVRIAVAHPTRHHPTTAVIQRLLADGTLGKLLEMRGRGKSDHRGGGEDLWVLGSHVLDLAQLFAGDPLSCSAILLEDGRRVRKSDVREGAEGLGPLAGDEVHARYQMSRGVVMYFDSIADDGTQGAGYGLRLVGSQGIVSIAIGRNPLAYLLPGNPFLAGVAEPRAWIPITSGGVGVPEPNPAAVANIYNHVAAVQDLIAACEREEGRGTPRCDGRAAANTIEMICGVFESHRQNSAAVPFPLSHRGNPLELLE